MTEHQVRIRSPRIGGITSINVDGVEIADLIGNINLHLTADGLPQVTLKLLATATDLELDAAYTVIGGETRALLERLGWTPPAAEQGMRR